MELRGKVVAITGAYKGLGAALSEAFAEKGCKLVLGGRNKEELLTFCQKIEKTAEAIPIVMDVRNKGDCEQIIKKAVDEFGRIDILINNAGVWWISDIENVSKEDVATMFETNTFGPLWSTRAALEVMKKQESGCIVNICSTAAVDYKSSHLLYGASKSALLGLTGCLAEDLKDTGIRIIGFCPGGMKTELFRHNPERYRDDFMDPSYVAEYLISFIESDSKEWLVILRRQ